MGKQEDGSPRKHRYYTTIYTLGTHQYTSFIYATTSEEANELAVRRNIGERVVGEFEGSMAPGFEPCPLASDLYRQRKINACCHCTSYLLYFYLKANSANVGEDFAEMLRDDGIVHELHHELHHPEEYGFREEILEKLLHIEAKIPGYHARLGKKTK